MSRSILGKRSHSINHEGGGFPVSWGEYPIELAASFGLKWTMKPREQSEWGSYELRENRSKQPRVGMPETLVLAQKLQAVAKENLHLGHRLADMVKNDQMLKSLCSKDPISFNINSEPNSETEGFSK